MKPRAWSSVLLLTPAGLLLAAFFIAPIGQFLQQGFLDREGGFTLSHALRLREAGTYADVMWTSLTISFWVTVFSILSGYPAAYVLANADRRGKGFWALFILLPFWSSFLVRTFAWIVILGRQGPVNAALLAAGISDRPQELLYSWGAVIIGMTNVLVPFAILTMVGVMERIDKTLMTAAGTLGARPVQAFFRIYLPLSMPGVTAAALLVFITALGFFMAPALLGSARETMITQLIIQQVSDLVNWHFAAILCLLLLAASLILFAVFDRLVGVSALSGTASLETGRQARSGANHAAYAISAAIGDALAAVAEMLGLSPPRTAGLALRTRIWAMFVVLFLVAPLLLLVPVSFTGNTYLSWPPVNPGLRWYSQVLTSPAWLSAAARSFIVALATAAVTVAIAVPAAFAFLRLSGRSASAAFALLISPLLVPRMVIAVSLFYVFAQLGLVGTATGLVIGHAIIALPYVFIAVIAVLKTYDRRLDQAAASLGASPLRTARHVTLPVISAGIISAALFAFIISLDELNIALFAAGGLQSTLPKMMWDEATLQFSPLLAAASTLVLAIMSAVVLLAARLRSSV
ncbi:ABC transporter permease subunit [Ferrovibrio sp.]|uniref:ABC transporter permease subunit n=1 Tax=Ferrovibrio sp. TaxID=1917215 RepID=UPI0026070435|nr:ABC transporter permease subunit [Ferrovibrio sp.]